MIHYYVAIPDSTKPENHSIYDKIVCSGDFEPVSTLPGGIPDFGGIKCNNYRKVRKMQKVGKTNTPLGDIYLSIASVDLDSKSVWEREYDISDGEIL